MQESMSRLRSLSAAGKLTVAGLGAAAGGIAIQIASGADYSTVPPGLVILLVAAGLVALATRWWWTPLAGLVVSAFLLLGGAVASNTRDHLGDPSEVGVFIGTVIQPLALVIALVASVAAAHQAGLPKPAPDMRNVVGVRRSGRWPSAAVGRPRATGRGGHGGSK